MRNVFIGGLCVLATLLMIYRYEPRDHVVSFVAGACAILLAIFPRTDPKMISPSPLQTGIGYAHWGFSIVFLLAIAFLVLYLFTLSDENASLNQLKVQQNNWYSTIVSTVLRPFMVLRPFRRSDQNTPSGRKLWRNRVYVGCGGVMLLTLVLLAIDQRFLPQLESYNPVFWCETITLFFFFVAWVVKGGLILIDENEDGLKTSFRFIFPRKDPQAKTIPSSTSAIGLSDTSHLTPELPFDDQSKQGASPSGEPGVA
jgi:magnesium-transporting ATPase (P-type)